MQNILKRFFSGSQNNSILFVLPSKFHFLNQKLKQDLRVNEIDIYYTDEQGINDYKNKQYEVVATFESHDYLIKKEYKYLNQIQWMHLLDGQCDFQKICKYKNMKLTTSRYICQQQILEASLYRILYFYQKSQQLQYSKQYKQLDFNFSLVECLIQNQSLFNKTIACIGYDSIIDETLRFFKKNFQSNNILIDDEIPYNNLYDQIYNFENRMDAILEADIIINLMPENQQNREMFGQKEFKQMKYNGVFLNFGSISVIDQISLCDALVSHKIFGAAIDVNENEIHQLNENHPYFTPQNLMLSRNILQSNGLFLQNSLNFFWENYNLFKQQNQLKGIISNKISKFFNKFKDRHIG